MWLEEQTTDGDKYWLTEPQNIAYMVGDQTSGDYEIEKIAGKTRQSLAVLWFTEKAGGVCPAVDLWWLLLMMMMMIMLNLI